MVYIGAWGSLDGSRPDFYQQGDTGNEAYTWGIRAIQSELDWRGYGPLEEDGSFGPLTDEAVKSFQRKRHDPQVRVDGIVGPATARRLFRKRIREQAKFHGVPLRWVFGLHNWESMMDPGATGWVDPRDRGLAQISSRWNPDIDDSEAFDPSFSIPFTTERIGRKHDDYVVDASGDVAWAAAVAYHHNPSDANKWALNGEPPNDHIKSYVEHVWSAGVLI